MDWKETVLDEEQRCVELTTLSCAAISGEDIRWNKVSLVIAEAQAQVSYRAGYDKAVEDDAEGWCDGYRQCEADHPIITQLKKWGKDNGS